MSINSTTTNLPAFIQALAPIVHSYGYGAVAVLLLLEDFGVPTPGETVLIAAAFYAGLGQLNIFVVALVGLVGAVLGDNIGFAIGTYGGRPLVARWGKYVFLNEARLTRAENFFNRHGGKVVVVARFIDGLRQLNGIIAGISDMRWPKFLVCNVIGAALWVGFWSAVGYYSGNHIVTFLHYQLVITAVVVVGLLIYATYWLAKRTAKS